MKMNVPDLSQTLTPVVEVLEQLSVPYHIGGSVASSLFGEARPTLDIDIVADLQLSQAHTFVSLLASDYYVVEDAVRDAIKHRSSFNLISQETFIKVDVFIPKLRAFDQDALRHLRQRSLDRKGRTFPVASPENMVINKLEWYKMGGHVSARQWNDILGILKAQGSTLDLTYLNRWAVALGVSDLLEHALVEANLQP